MVNLIGIGVCLIFILFIINNKKVSRADVYLIAINIVFAAILGFEVLINQTLTPELVIIYQVIVFLLFPFFFLYGMEIMRFDFPYKAAMFIPAFGLFVYMIFDFYVWRERSVEHAEFIYRYPTLTYHIFYKGQLLLTIVGEVAFLRQIKKYQKGIRNLYSYIEPIELQWLKLVTIVFLFVTGFSLILFLIYNFYSSVIDIEFISRIVNGFAVLAIFYMSYNGIRLYASQNSAGVPLSAIEEKLPDEPKKYSKYALREDTLQDIHAKLLSFFEKEKPFLEAQLQLHFVAQKLQVSTHALSQTINTAEKKSFYDFVNQYRIEHFKRLLSDQANKKFSILALGLDSGFNSKASMNRIFKELTGQSPSAYQKAKKEVSLS